jgi:hypothetical protein
MPGASCSRLTPPLRVSRFWTPSMKMGCWQSLRLSGIGWKGSWIASISRTENDSVAVGVEGEGEQAGLLSALPTDEEEEREARKEAMERGGVWLATVQRERRARRSACQQPWGVCQRLLCRA